MRLLTKVAPLPDYRLACTFEDGTEKIANISQYLHSEVFKPLTDLRLFNTVQNRQYYVEWLDGEVDLSADTLWYIGELIEA